VAYRQAVTAWQASWNETVRSTARAVRLRPARREDLAGVLDRDLDGPSGGVSLDHLRGGRGGIGGDQGQVMPRWLTGRGSARR
jgi:hypothetical protein